MHIKDVEQRTGLSRANIRYYEQEGLVHPARRKNGYRDYSPDDLETLLRIRLLRRLDVPIEEIRSMQAGKLSLSEALSQRLAALRGQNLPAVVIIMSQNSSVRTLVPRGVVAAIYVVLCRVLQRFA